MTKSPNLSPFGSCTKSNHNSGELLKVMTQDFHGHSQWMGFLSMAYGVTVRIVAATGKHKRTATGPQRRFRHWFRLHKAKLGRLM